MEVYLFNYFTQVLFLYSVQDSFLKLMRKSYQQDDNKILTIIMTCERKSVTE